MFPGIPVFHSKDLCNWRLLCYAASRPSQLHVFANAVAGGVMAPTIRHHDGVFYIIDANFCDRGNFILKATDPAGPWSEPYFLEDVPGIDASLFFDDDGSAYVVGTGTITKPNGLTGRGIYLKSFDVNLMRATGEEYHIWDSALNNAASPEAPHIYKKDGWYYLIIAEGGTEHYHSVTVARSRTLNGWYEGNPANPIMTHRHLGYDYPICNVGHADLVDTQNGEWYAVMLASRLIGGYHKNLGRETFIAPVIWENDWPVISPGTGKVEWCYLAPDLPWTEFPKQDTTDDFDGDELDLQWNFWGTPYDDFWKLENSMLKLKCLPRSISRELVPVRESALLKTQRGDNVSFIGRRQCDVNFTASTKMLFVPENESETAGLIILQASNYHYRVERAMKDNKQILRLIHSTGNINGGVHLPHFKSNTVETTVNEVECDNDYVYLKLEVSEQDFNFYYGQSEEDMALIGNVDGSLINLK